MCFLRSHSLNVSLWRRRAGGEMGLHSNCFPYEMIVSWNNNIFMSLLNISTYFGGAYRVHGEIGAKGGKIKNINRSGTAITGL